MEEVTSSNLVCSIVVKTGLIEFGFLFYNSPTYAVFIFRRSMVERKTTKQLLAESFKELAETRPVNKITIQEIAGNCGYSPATFYRHFNDKFDLIVWDYTSGCRKMMSRIGKDGVTWECSVLSGCQYLFEHKKYLKNLLLNTNGHDSFIRYMSLTNMELLTDEIKRKAGGEGTVQELLPLIKIYSYGTACLAAEYLTGEDMIQPGQLSRMMIRGLPEPLIPWLCS